MDVHVVKIFSNQRNSRCSRERHVLQVVVVENNVLKNVNFVKITDKPRILTTYFKLSIIRTPNCSCVSPLCKIKLLNTFVCKTHANPSKQFLTVSRKEQHLFERLD